MGKVGKDERQGRVAHVVVTPISSSSPPPSNDGGPGPIVMYGADWCGDCRRAKAYFAAHDIAYDYVDLEAHPEKVDTVLDRNNGVKKIPVIVFADDSHLVEPTDADLKAKVTALTTVPTNMASGHPTVIDNVDRSRFELRNESETDSQVVSFASYSTNGNNGVVVPHVETAFEHRGNGFAEELLDGVMANLRKTQRTITPLCPFAARYMQDRPETHDLLTA